MSSLENAEPSSFKDPSGHVFHRDGEVFRQVNSVYRENYDLLMESGLYKTLVKKKLLVFHEEELDTSKKGVYKILKSQKVPLISYPYEWSFSQLKAAALLTLRIQKVSMSHGMSLKDATPYNVQFIGYRPIFIDTLSFEKLNLENGWVAYRQFCETFLSSLALTSYSDIQLSVLLKTYFHGIPLSLTNKLLPKRAFRNLSLLLHIKAHSKFQDRHSNDGKKQKGKGGVKKQMSEGGLRGVIDSLTSCVKRMSLPKAKTEWGDYYNDTNYSNESFKNKQRLVADFLGFISPKTVWDMGGNRGEFSRIASDMGAYTVSCDIDPLAVEQNYLESKKRKEKNLIPLLQDIANPSPALGWRLQERESLVSRCKPDCIMALALIHHLAMTYNLPLNQIAGFFSSLAPYLIIEFVPKSDSQVKRLLFNREDVFCEYDQESFQKALGDHYEVLKEEKVDGSERTLYLCKRK